MADKNVQLSITLSAIDKATAPIKALNARLDETTKPLRNFKEALTNLRASSGLDSVIGGFKGVGSAIGGVLAKIGLIGGVAGAAVAGLMSIVNEFDELGDKAEAIGVSVDFLAQMRNAAERSGASVEQLDSGMQGFVTSIGLARAGTGRMLAFLNQVSPTLARQLKATKSNEEALYLLADAAAKLKDPAKQAAFAQKTLGDASLGPMLHRGSKALKELNAEYFKHTGSLEGAATVGGRVDDSMKKLKSTSIGIKAALLKGLGPALDEIVNKLDKWFMGHREDIEKWAAEIGEKLPGALENLVDGIGDVIGEVADFVDSIGGWKTAAIGLAAVILGPLIGAVASFGAALLTTPIGWAIGLIAGVVALYENWDRVVDAVREYTSMGPIVERMNKFLHSDDAEAEAKNNIVENFAGNADEHMGAFFDGVRGGKDNVTGSNSAFFDAVRKAAPTNTSATAKVTIDIPNLPRGARAKLDPASTADVDLSVGPTALFGP